MRQYFEKMTEFGSELNKGKLLSSEKNLGLVQEVEAGIESGRGSQDKCRDRRSRAVAEILEHPG